MAVILLEIARIFATKVPGKIDADVLQLLWKVFSSCGCNSKAINLLTSVVFIFLFQNFIVFRTF